MATKSAYRILYFSSAPFIGGGSRSLETMLRHVDRRRFEPRLILGHETDMARIAESMDVGVQIIPMPRRERWRLLSWWRSLRAIEREMDRFRPHLVHANDVLSCQAMSVAAGRRRIPRVVHLRWPIDARALGWWARGGVEQILCVANWIREQLGSASDTPLSGARISVLADPVAWTARVSSRRRPTGTGRPAPVALRLGFVGQLIDVKGLDLVIQAIARIASERRPTLLVAGEDRQTGGAHQRYLQDLAAEHGVADRITWLGFLQDVTQLYRQVDAMVCPSRIEPLSLVPLEAAEFALPVIASDVDGFRETIRHGESGCLVEPTVEAWARALAAIEGPEQLRPLGRRLRRHVLEVHSSDLFQRQLADCYLHLLGGDSASSESRR